MIRMALLSGAILAMLIGPITGSLAWVVGGAAILFWMGLWEIDEQLGPRCQVCDKRCSRSVVGLFSGGPVHAHCYEEWKRQC